MHSDAAPQLDAANAAYSDTVAETLRFWREVARGAAPDHPSHVVVRVLEGLVRHEERRA